MSINPTQVKSMKPAPGKKVTRVYDGNGLYLFITEKGAKYWRFKTRYQGKEILLSLGVFPTVSLADARRQSEEYKEMIRQGVNPATNRKAAKVAQAAVDSFETVAREWFTVYLVDKATSHRRVVVASLEHDVFPAIGTRQISEVTALDLLEMLRRIERRGAVETAHRVMNRCSQVFRYGISTGRCQADPTAWLRGALKPVIKNHLAAITEPSEVGRMLQIIDGYKGSTIVRCAMLIAPLVFVMPGELRQAEWKDIDFNRAEWRFNASKTGQQHIVSLSRQAIAILRTVSEVTGSSKYVFHGVSVSRPMSNNAVLAAFRRMGITGEEMTGHGWRATARTLLDEVLKYPPHIIEQQLAHVVRDPLGRA